MKSLVHLLIAVPYLVLGTLTVCCWPIVAGSMLCEGIWEWSRQ